MPKKLIAEDGEQGTHRASLRKLRQLLDLIENAREFFVCNTNRKYSPDGTDENLMRRKKHAIAWTSFRYPKRMEQVIPGDAIFMFAKGVGIIAVGRASGKCKVVAVGRPGRFSRDRGNDEEWQVPVDDWLVWKENDEEAYKWRGMPNASFVYASGDAYRERRDALRRRVQRALSAQSAQAD